jgi:hypothetical protein
LEPKAPAPLKDSKPILGGTLTWDISVSDVKKDKVKAEFTYKPSKDNKAKTIVFLQVVIESTVGDYVTYPGFNIPPEEIKQNPQLAEFDKERRKYWEAFVTDLKRGTHADITKGDKKLYMAVRWDGAKWVGEKDVQGKVIGKVGNGPDGIDAWMEDEPFVPAALARKGKTAIKRYETIVFSVDTMEVLGTITWGFDVPPDKDGDVKLVEPKVTDKGPSDDFRKAVEKANAQDFIEHKVGEPKNAVFGGISALPKKENK